jgi:hypothetical protein
MRDKALKIPVRAKAKPQKPQMHGIGHGQAVGICGDLRGG